MSIMTKSDKGCNVAPPYVYIDIWDLQDSENNARLEAHSKEHLDIIENEIRSGILMPMKINNDNGVVDGKGRLEVLRNRIAKEGVPYQYPCIRLNSYDSLEQLSESVASSTRSEPLSENSKRQAVYQLIDGDWSNKRINRKTGIHMNTIARWIFERWAIGVNPMFSAIEAMPWKEWRSFKSLYNQSMEKLGGRPEGTRPKSALRMAWTMHSGIPGTPYQFTEVTGPIPLDSFPTIKTVGKGATMPLRKEKADGIKTKTSKVGEVLAEARKQEYKYIPISLALSILRTTYIPYIKLSKLRKKSIGEIITWLMDENVDRVKKELESK